MSTDEADREICGLCGHLMTMEACGSARADGVPLCHTDNHSCYHRWTAYGERPTVRETWDPAGEDEAEVWIPPRSDCMQHRPNSPCPHCGGPLWHVRTQRCSDCGRRPYPSRRKFPAGEPTINSALTVPTDVVARAHDPQEQAMQELVAQSEELGLYEDGGQDR